MPTRPRLLIVDDDRTIRESLASAFDEAGYDVCTVDGVVSARGQLDAEAFEGVLLDIRLKDGDGLDLLGEVRRRYPAVPVIMATAYGDSDRTIRAMSLGAFDYVTKPFDLDALLATVARAVTTPPVARVAEPSAADTPLVGSSPAMLEVWKAVGRAATSSAPVLITGESGVGKELVARAIHDNGPRRAQPFVAVNVSALPLTLVESELFGHEKGAFTGAFARQLGRFEVAGEGTLFLDEVGDLDVALQTKLLRVLEDGSFERVGASERQVSRARILAATSRPVTPRTPGATLREDLYYRLGVVRIDVPPLRDRAQDVPLLVDMFLRRRPGPRRAVSEAAMALLVDYDWPGNVRQLLHMLESAAVMSTSEVLDVDNFQGLCAPVPAIAQGAGSFMEGDAVLDDGDLDVRRHVERLERSLIQRALALSKGNRAQAARRLGMRRATLYARMKYFGILWAPNGGESE
jgi:DNA-binding NtrC family response regulator